MDEFIPTTILDDSLEIINNINYEVSKKKNKFTKFIAKHYLMANYKRRVIKIYDKMIASETILPKEDIYDLIMKLYNSFPSSNGGFGMGVEFAQHYILNQNSPKEYAMNEIKINMDEDRNESAQILVHDERSSTTDISVEFRSVYDQKHRFANLSTFTGPRLESDNGIYKDKLRELNLILLKIMKEYVLYCFNNIDEMEKEN